MPDERDRLLDALSLKEVDRVPCASPLQTGTVDLMRASGAYWPEANNDPATMAMLSKAAHTLAGIESVRVPFDVCVDATAFGAVTALEGVDRQPAIPHAPIRSVEDLRRLADPDPRKDGRAPVVLEAVRLLAGEMVNTPVICGVVGPFMLAGQLRGAQEAIMDVMIDPESLKEILERTTEWGIAYSLAALEAGADVITVVDATSSGDVLGPSQYAEFARPYQRGIADAVRRSGGRSILHICGNTAENLPYMAQAGFDGISVDQQMDIGWVKGQLRGRVAAIGNVSPTTTLLFGRPEDVEDESRRCIMDGTDVLAPGCGFAPATPLENMRAMVRAARSFGPRDRL